MEISEALVYVICHPSTNELVYVGKTKNLKLRRRYHLARKTLFDLYQWFEDLKAVGLEPKFVPITQYLSPEKASRFEQICIFRGFILGGRLKNKQPMTSKFLNEQKTNKGITLDYFLNYMHTREFSDVLGFNAVNCLAA